MLNARQLQQLRQEPGNPNRVKAAMRLARATQLMVSAGTGLAQSHISKVANDGPSVTVETASKLARFFGCRIEDLFPRQSQETAA